MTERYAIHPLAALIPEMNEDEYRNLVQDIAANGLRQPVLLFEHMVLDGRHRLRACEETGTEVRFEEYAGVQPAAYVLSLNLRRRHLSSSQQAMIVTDFLPELEKEARERKARAGREHGRGMDSTAPNGAELSDAGRASEKAAELVGASPRTIERANRVKKADPDLADQVRAGEISVWTAEAIAKGQGRLDPKPQADNLACRAQEPESGSVSARSVERIARMAAGLAPAIEHLNLTKSCARLTDEEREEALSACKSGLKALNALARALGR